MQTVVKGLEKAMNAMDLEKISKIMDKFESQVEDSDVRISVSYLFINQYDAISVYWILSMLIHV